MAGILLDAARWAIGMATIGRATTGTGTAILITFAITSSSSVASAFHGGGAGAGAGVRGGAGILIHMGTTVMAIPTATGMDMAVATDKVATDKVTMVKVAMVAGGMGANRRSPLSTGRSERVDVGCFCPGNRELFSAPNSEAPMSFC